jgi:probable HAF family extracellular repeat protein
MNRPQLLNAGSPLVLLCGLLLLSPASAFAANLVPFDARGAGTGASQGTFGLAINDTGQITGYYVDPNFLAHGFVRDNHGTIADFDAPGAAGGTFAFAINQEGDITGYSYDVNFLAHGFVRDHNGVLTPFDAPGAAAGGIGTYASGINDDGTVVGYFYDINAVSHGFVRNRNGGFTTIDDPNAGTGFFEGSAAVVRNFFGIVVGCYTNANYEYFNFLQTPEGALVPLNPPGGAVAHGICGFTSTSVIPAGSAGINVWGVVTGAYFEPVQGNPFGGNYRGFVRGLDGRFVTFDAVSSPSSPCCTWTWPVSINFWGQIAGYDNDFDGINHAVLREPNGAITVFDAPNAGTGLNQGTVAASINDVGTIAGYYKDSNNVAHGFLRAQY